MRLVHMADVHLGYRAYNRINRAGINAREADVFDAFRTALAKTAELDPDVVLIAGDLFHVVRPSNMMIQYAFREFVRFRSRSSAPIVILGGNHDSPRSTDTGCILDLFSNVPDIHVAHTNYVQVKLEDLDTSVFCLCHRALPELSELKVEPDPESKYNVLMVHGTVDGVIRHAYDLQDIRRDQVISEAWDYVAFGHYHIFEQLAPNAYYSGSLEYTSTNIWSETGKPKGFVEYDLDDRQLVSFHQVQTRDAVDLRPIDALEVDADSLNRMIEQRIESVPEGHTNKIVRLVVDNLHRSVQADIDWSTVRKVRAEALHFDLQLRPPTRDGRSGDRSQAGQSKSLEEEWDEFGRAYEIAPGIEREAFVTLGRDYIMKQQQSENAQ